MQDVIMATGQDNKKIDNDFLYEFNTQSIPTSHNIRCDIPARLNFDEFYASKKIN